MAAFVSTLFWLNFWIMEGSGVVSSIFISVYVHRKTKRGLLCLFKDEWMTMIFTVWAATGIWCFFFNLSLFSWNLRLWLTWQNAHGVTSRTDQYDWQERGVTDRNCENQDICCCSPTIITPPPTHTHTHTHSHTPALSVTSLHVDTLYWRMWSDRIVPLPAWTAEIMWKMKHFVHTVFF